MAVLGHDVPRPCGRAEAGLRSLLDRLEAPADQAQGHALRGGQLRAGGPRRCWPRSRPPATRSPVTVPTTADCRARWLGGLVAHGPRNARGPPRRPRARVPVAALRRPRRRADLARYRDELAEAGYRYVSDASRLGPAHRCARCPCSSWRGLRIGGGSYQRLLPFSAGGRGRSGGATAPAVLYYHSYDFDGTLPGLRRGALADAGRQVARPRPDRADRMAPDRTLRKRDLRPCHHADFDGYFHDRASRFAAFYRSEAVSRLIGRGPLFDRCGQRRHRRPLGATHVLDVGCGSGPLFAPLAARGVRRDGDRPRAGHGGAGPGRGRPVPRAGDGARSGGGRPSTRSTPTTSPSPSGSSTTSTSPPCSCGAHGPGRSACRGVVPGTRACGCELRRVRYGARGVHVHGYRPERPRRAGVGSAVSSSAELRPLGRAGYLAHFVRARALSPRSTRGSRNESPQRRHGLEAEALHAAAPGPHRPWPGAASGRRDQSGRGVDHGVEVVDVDDESPDPVLHDGPHPRDRRGHHGQAAHARFDEHARHALAGGQAREHEDVGPPQDLGHVVARPEHLDPGLGGRARERRRPAARRRTRWRAGRGPVGAAPPRPRRSDRAACPA